MPFPTITTLDDFTRANEDPITTNWTTPHYTGRNNARLNSNRMERVVTNTSVWGASWDVSTFGPDMSLKVTVGNISDTGENMAIFFCQSNINYDVGSGYFLLVNFVAGTDDWRFYKWDGAAATALGTLQTKECVSGDIFAVIRNGSGLEAWHRTPPSTDTQVISITDNTYIQSGYVMIEGSNGSNFQIDDFGANTLGGSGGGGGGSHINMATVRAG